MATCWSTTGPQAVSGVPQMSMTSWVMRSMCSTVRLRVDAALEAVAGVGGEVVAARGPCDALGHQKASM